MAHRRRQLHNALGAVAPTPPSSAALASHHTLGSPVRARIAFVLLFIEDKALLQRALSSTIPAGYLCGIGTSWLSADRLSFENAPQTPDDIANSLQVLLAKVGKSYSFDVVLLVGGDLPSPEDAVVLFSAVDATLTDEMCQSRLHILCLDHCDLNDWDVLLGADVTRVRNWNGLRSQSFINDGVIWRGCLSLSSGRSMSGIYLSKHSSCKPSGGVPVFPCKPLQALSRVQLDTVPISLFRKSIHGDVRWKARGVYDRVLTSWASGNGIMAEGHGLFLHISDGPIILIFPGQHGGLCFRTISCDADEAKLSGGNIYAYLWMNATPQHKPTPSKQPFKTGSTGLERTKPLNRSQILLQTKPLDLPSSPSSLVQKQKQKLCSAEPIGPLTESDKANHSPAIGVEYCNDNAVNNDASITTLHNLFLPTPHRRLAPSIALTKLLSTPSNILPESLLDGKPTIDLEPGANGIEVDSDQREQASHAVVGQSEMPSMIQEVNCSSLMRDAVKFVTGRVRFDLIDKTAADIVQVIRDAQ